MGKLYARNTILAKIDGIAEYLNDESIDNPVRSDIIIFLKNELNGFTIENIIYEEDYSGEVEVVEFKVHEGENNDEINIDYEVVASYPRLDKQTGQEQETFTIRADSVGGSGNGGSGNDDVNWDDRFDDNKFEQRDGSNGVINYNEDAIIDGNVRFLDRLRIGANRQVTATGNIALESGTRFPNSGELVVEGSFFAEGSQIDLNQSSRILVKKNAYLIDVEMDYVSGQRNSHLCVEGDLYLSYSGGSTPPAYETVPTCEVDEIDDIGLYVVGDVFDYDPSSRNDGGSGSTSWVPVGTR
ncbi:hypothetical protein ACM26V_14640 [Salipaludibacillus sp. HK11]|uniref:hypothetical protein n=1 Tax=Salipaludibacillus sp. HK11 TaxID=3394320 RepID=UPI0039FD23F0